MSPELHDDRSTNAALNLKEMPVGGSFDADHTRFVRIIPEQPAFVSPVSPEQSRAQYITTPLVSGEVTLEPPTRLQRLRRYIGRAAARLGRRESVPTPEANNAPGEFVKNVVVQERFVHNQDAYLQFEDTLAVYDGAGGAGGDPAAAANAARQATLAILQAEPKPQTADEARRMQAVMFRDMRNAVAQTEGSTTAAVATIVESPLTGDRQVVYRLAGDSRIAVLCANGEVEFLGRDQSYEHPDGPAGVYRMLTNGISTVYDGETEDSKTRQMADDTGVYRLAPGDRVLLATDGLFGDDRNVGPDGKTQYIDETEFQGIYQANREEDSNSLCGAFATASRKVKDDMTILVADIDYPPEQPNRREQRHRERAISRRRNLVRVIGTVAGAAALTGAAIAANYFGVMNSLAPNDREYDTPIMPPQAAAPITPGTGQQAAPAEPAPVVESKVMPSGNTVETTHINGKLSGIVVTMGPDSNPYRMAVDANRVAGIENPTPEQVAEDNPFTEGPLADEAENLENARIGYVTNVQGEPIISSVAHNYDSPIE